MSEKRVTAADFEALLDHENPVTAEPVAPEPTQIKHQEAFASLSAAQAGVVREAMDALILSLRNNGFGRGKILSVRGGTLAKDEKRLFVLLQEALSFAIAADSTPPASPKQELARAKGADDRTGYSSGRGRKPPGRG